MIVNQWVEHYLITLALKAVYNRITGLNQIVEHIFDIDVRGVAVGVTEDELTDGEFPGVGGSDGNGSDDEEEATDDEFPGVDGSDGNGSDDGSSSDVEGPSENLSSMTLSPTKLITINSWNQSLRMSSFIFLLFFFILSTYFFTVLLNFRGAQ